MKIFIRYIITYFKQDFNLTAHLVTALFLSFALYYNFVGGIEGSKTFYRTITYSYNHQFVSIIYLFGFYAFSFFSAVIISSVFAKKNTPKLILNKKYLVWGAIGLIFLALDSSYYLMNYFNNLFEGDIRVKMWINACISNLHSSLSVILPLFLIYLLTKYFKPEWYGLRLNGAKVIPYFWLILFMIPLIYAASFQPDFLKSYPSYNLTLNEHEQLDLPQWITAGIYELCYAFDFLSVELFFRGFMVIALSRFVGKEAILPMVVVYCFLHFGKPAGEAISSIFGGYILGILAYSSRNIYGGLIAHIGVAWGMEYMAYINL